MTITTRSITSRSIVALVFLCTLTANVSCDKKTSPAPANTSSSFSSTDIVGTWTSNCTAGTDPITNGTYHIVEISLNSGGNFNAIDMWFSASNCGGASYVAVYGTTGTYSVGAIISGSSRALDFDITDSDIMPMTVQSQTDVNADCGGSSPFTGGANVSNNGHHFSTYMMSCMSAVFPNAVNDAVNNLATYNGTILTIGEPAFGIPGVFMGNTLPSSATLVLY
jgi:hypothetical protein